MLSNKRIRIEKNIITRIYRGLPGKGNLTVSEKAEVIPSDIIGSAEISSGFKIINIAQLLSIPPDQVQKYLQRGIGQRIYKGELLAKKSGGLFGGEKIITASTDSVIDFINPQTGEVRLSILPRKVDLPAGVYGVVEKVDKARGKVLIRTQVSRVYGALGAGRVREGILHNLGDREKLVVPSMILPDFSDRILLGGGLVYKEALSAAISAGVSGIITGGLNAKDYRAIAGGRIIFPKKLETDVGISVITTEGFGSVPIGQDIYGLLSTYDGKFVTIDGNAAVINLPVFDASCIVAVRKTSLPPVSEDTIFVGNRDYSGVAEVQVGMKARVIGNAYLGEQGVVVAVDKSESLMPSKVRVLMVTLETKRRKLQIPINNIEIF